MAVEPSEELEPYEGDVGDSVMRSVLRLPELRNVTEQYAEAGLDAFVDNDAIDAIPVVGSVLALWRGVQGFREAWLLKKLVKMLYGVGEASDNDVKAWRARIESEGPSREMGERILALVDRVTSAHKAALIGCVLREYLDGHCDRQRFLRTAEMIDSTLTEDLHYLIDEWSEDMDDDVCKRLMAVGLMQDRSSKLLLESSQPPIPSAEGFLIRSTKGDK